ncbi:MAG: BamA/TamA family outer membrane protein, partial [Rickettsiales bacterium]
VAILDDSSRQINIIYNILIGKEATLGDISFKGNNKIATEHLQKLLTIKKGDCFKRKEINAASLALQNTGLLSTVETELTSELGSDGEVPIVFNISERAMRSIKAGANYSTDIGVGVNLGWEHRNFLGYGEKLTTALEIAAPKQAISAQFRKPFFLRDDQRLKLSSSLKREDSDAYQTTGINVSGGIERDIDNKWLVGVGAKYELSRIKDNVSSKDVALLSIPVFASQDKRDDVLDPSYGWTLRVDSTPFFDTINANTVFYKNKIGGTYYQKLPIANKPILALRANTGSIAGINTESVPATERFFAGGGGSIRGYGYQLAGPLDASNNPVGGRSFIETSVELRAKLTNEYGFVLFVDGGNVYDAAIPNFSDKMLFGAGIGVRYYTSFGPLRGDIAIPLDKRTGGVDAPYQLYFSIGQDF